MRVLVTGGTGFIGSHTALALLGEGHEVRLLVRDEAKARRVFDALGAPLPECVRGDMVDAVAVGKALDGADAVVHAAALVALAAQRAQDVLESNARGVETVIGGALAAGVGSIVYVSSVSALFRAGGPPIRPDSPVVPGRNAYARSKAQGEEVVRRWQAEGAPIHTTYPTAVVGPDDPGLSESNHAIQVFLRDTMVMTSSGFQLVDVRDLARVHARLVSDPGAPARHLVAGHHFPWRELADLIDRLTGRPVRRIPAPGVLLRAGGKLGDWVKRVRSFDFPLTSEAMAFATQWQPVDDRETREKLGIEYRDPGQTLIDTMRWLSRSGHLTPEQIGRAASGSAASGARGDAEEGS
ncbi:MAG: SDR family NAD(P)-dependent oxidoreductase [Myxococcota bacterium]